MWKKTSLFIMRCIIFSVVVISVVLIIKPEVVKENDFGVVLGMFGILWVLLRISKYYEEKERLS